MPSYVVISFHKWLNHYIIFLQPSNFVSEGLKGKGVQASTYAKKDIIA
jgi:hypothetical protein